MKIFFKLLVRFQTPNYDSSQTDLLDPGSLQTDENMPMRDTEIRIEDFDRHYKVNFKICVLFLTKINYRLKRKTLLN